MSMKGFDPEFTDIVDYILRITERIWEGKQVGLCRRFYSDDCPVYTLAGYSEGAEVVEQNTLKTLAGFPDRTLHADNIIWSGNESAGFHTSHRICSHMTNLGPSEFGEPTGKGATIQVIAHCVVKENRIVEEWLVRDNLALARQLGVDPEAYAEAVAARPIPDGDPQAAWLASEWARVRDGRGWDDSWRGESREAATLADRFAEVWNSRMVGDCRELYADHAQLHASARPVYDGVTRIEQFYLSILGALPDARIAFDFGCENSMLAGDHIALRWTLAGTHSGSALWGPASQAPVLILGESHYRLENGKIAEEWLVFDELAVLTQIARARLAQ